MPTYEYRCKECGHEFEIVQSFSDDALTECPECEGALKKVYGNVGISFKGSGFYKNDARASSGGSGGSSKTTESSSTGTESSSSSSTSSTTEKKKDSATSSSGSSGSSSD